MSTTGKSRSGFWSYSWSDWIRIKGILDINIPRDGKRTSQIKTEIVKA